MSVDSVVLIVSFVLFKELNVKNEQKETFFAIVLLFVILYVVIMGSWPPKEHTESTIIR